MKAIQIKFLNTTNHKPARLKAWTEAGQLIVSRDYDLEYADQVRFLASQYIVKQGWRAGIGGIGVLPNGDYVATLCDLPKEA